MDLNDNILKALKLINTQLDNGGKTLDSEDEFCDNSLIEEDVEVIVPSNDEIKNSSASNCF